MKNKLFLLLISLCMALMLGIFASAENVAYIAHNGGAAANDGLTDQTPKNGLGSMTGTGVAGVLKDGGTLVVSEKMYIGVNYKWNVNGQTLITAVYGGKDYRNANPATNPASGVIKFKPNITWTIASDVTLDKVILHMDAKISVAEGVTFTVNDTVDTVPRGETYSSIVVARGANAVINGGTYQSIEGLGNIVIGDKVTVLEGEYATGGNPTSGEKLTETEKPAETEVPSSTVKVDGAVAYISHNKGNNSNSGLSDTAAKSGLGNTSGNGVVGLLKNGGTLVVCEKMYLGVDYKWKVDGEALITGVYGGKNYINAEPANNPASGVLKFKPNVTLTVASDLTFDNVLLHQEATILVTDGATLTITDTVKTMPRAENYISIVVEKGAKAIINGGTYKSIEGEGEIVIGEGAKLLSEAAKSTVAYMSHNNGKASNDGLTDQTPKTGWGSTTGTGVAGILKNGGTLVACEKMYIGTNYKWEVSGDTVITAVYGGKDYRNAEPADNPASGVLKIKPDVTFTIGSNVTFDNIILHQDATVMVAPGATLIITDTVTTMPRDGGYLNIIVSSGAKAVINGGTYGSIAGNGDITVGDKVKVVGNADKDIKPIERVSGVCYIDNALGSDKNDGSSAASALKTYGNGVFGRLPVGGTVVVSGKSHIYVSGSASAFDFTTWTKAVTITSVYDGTDYRKSNADAAFSIADNTSLHVYSDVKFDNVNLVCDGEKSTIYVHSGATLTVTDSVELITKAQSGKHFTINLEKGAYAHLSKAAAEKLTVIGDGEIIPYTNGISDAFGYVLGTKTMVQLTIGSATAYVNGAAHTLDAAPINRNNRTMLPVRFLANAFGIADDGIAWDGATSTATLTGSEVKISITIGASYMTVNGEKVALDSPALIENSRTYLPVRAIANALGVSNDNIGWLAETSTATLLK